MTPGGIFGGSAPGAHTHVEADITDLDKYSVAAADAAFAAISHTHLEADITDLQAYLLNITGEPFGDLSDVTITAIAAGEIPKWSGSAWINNTLAEAGIAATGHTHVEANITNLDKYSVAAADAAFAALSHTHLEADITDLQSYLVSPLTTNGDVLYYNAGHQRLAKGADSEVLTLAAGVPTWAAAAGGVTDHGALTGLGDDDHTQYHTDARGNALYSVLAHTHLEADITDLGTYLPLTAGTGKRITGTFYVANANPRIRLVETDGTVDNTVWDFLVNSNQLRFQLRDDAEAAATNWLEVSRTLNLATKVNFITTALQFNSVDVVTKKMTTNGDILYYNSGRQRLAKGTNGEVLTLASGIPSWAAAGGGIANTVSTSAPSGSASDGDIWCRI